MPGVRNARGGPATEPHKPHKPQHLPPSLLPAAPLLRDRAASPCALLAASSGLPAPFLFSSPSSAQVLNHLATIPLLLPHTPHHLANTRHFYKHMRLSGMCLNPRHMSSFRWTPLYFFMKRNGRVNKQVHETLLNYSPLSIQLFSPKITLLTAFSSFGLHSSAI